MKYNRQTGSGRFMRWISQTGQIRQMRPIRQSLSVFLVLLLAVMSFAGCSFSGGEDESQAVAGEQTGTDGSGNNKSGEGESTEETQDFLPDKIQFVDVEGISYTVPFQKEWKLHNYNWNYLKDENGIKSYADQNYETRLGIDVSKYQNEVDWDRVKAAGVEFVILRIGYRGYGESGVLRLDERFVQHLAGAQKAGLDVGVYFFSQAISEEEAEEEAEFVIEHLKGVELQCPVFFDPENIKDAEARTDDVTGEQFTENAVVFCEKIREAGYEPMVYSNMVWEAYKLDLSRLEEYGIWYADYEASPQTPYEFEYWQYTETGTIDGIDGIIDLNIQFIPQTNPDQAFETTAKGESGKTGDSCGNRKIAENNKNIQKQAEAILKKMTLEEKAAQLFIITPEALTGIQTVVQAGTATQEKINQYPVGGLIYFSQNMTSYSQTKKMLANIQQYSEKRTGLPLFLCVDEEGGTVARVGNNSAFQVEKIDNMKKIGESGDVSKALEAGDTIGTYLSNLGFNLDFAPVADVLTNSENTVVKQRSFGSDAQLVSDMSLSVLEGLNNHGVYGTLKHFPGHGATAADTHEGYAYTDKTKEELMKSEWIPFIDGIENGTDMIMVGHISVPSITDDHTPASLSSEVIQDILRDELGFEGLVVTDALNMGAIQNSYGSAEAAVKAVQAGVDLLLMPADFNSAYNGIISAVKTGKITEERLDESVVRIIQAKLRLN